MALQIYNTLGGKKEDFQPLEPGRIRLYVCGNTVYDYAHIGHARVMVAFDVIVRYLRFRGWQVTYARNITDIDDKIVNRAAEYNEPFTALTERMIAAQHEDEKALGVLPPDLEPRATDHIEDMIDMIQTLVDNHYAYATDNGDVYFRVKRFPDYGKLSGKKLDELLSGARVEVGEIKEDARDFALWKGAPEDEPGWRSPWGWGRPGWHIECSAMSTCHLGESLDIHGGGPDLIFPHHENEIAQSEAATCKHFVHYWMHAGAVRVDDEKMSKSLGNFFTIREVLAKYHPEVVRYLLISSHYRSAINYSEDNLVEARNGLTRFYTALREYRDVAAADPEDLRDSRYYRRFIEVMDDDFNTREALTVLHELVGAINSADDREQARQGVSELLALGGILGLLADDPEAFFTRGPGGDNDLTADEIEALIDQRIQARKDRDFAGADRIRDQLRQKGIVLEDTRQGTLWRRE